jgi:hypothetical protein
MKPTPVVEAGEQSRGPLPRVTAERHGLRAKVRATELAGQHWPKVVARVTHRAGVAERENFAARVGRPR